jgi:hypothetical protein
MSVRLVNDGKPKTDYKIRNLLAHVREHRKELVAAAISLLRWHINHEDELEVDQLSSFEAWSDIICGAIVRAGLPSPLLARATIEEVDQDKEQFETLLFALHRLDLPERFTTRQVSNELQRTRTDDRNAAIDALEEAGLLKQFGDPETLDKPKLGRWLRSHKGRRNEDGWYIERLPKKHRNGAVLWSIHTDEDAEDDAEV